MANIWVVSDCHFGHNNVLKFKDDDGNLIRGSKFSSIEEMDEHLIERWNSVVKAGDKVYNLGDVYFGQGHRVLPRLMGELPRAKAPWLPASLVIEIPLPNW